MRQEDRLLNYLNKNKYINPLESWTELGIYRLSAVIYRLRQEGHNIKTREVKVQNKWGDVCAVAKYEFIKN
jgi:hypothetical protein